jgi:hypothetical protein
MELVEAIDCDDMGARTRRHSEINHNPDCNAVNLIEHVTQ